MNEIPLERHELSARRARQLVAEALVAADAPPASVDDARLLASELVANALLHADGEIRLRYHIDGRTARIGIRDGDPTRPTLRQPSGSEGSGRGILLLDRLAQRWGVDPDGDSDGKTVWFEIAW